MAGKRATKNNNSEQISLYDYQLKEVSVRLVLNEESALYSSTPIKTPADAVTVMADLLKELDRETVCTINISLDNKLRPVGYTYNVVSIGDISSSMVPVGNCFKAALLQNAAAMCCLLCHNHRRRILM